MRAQEPDQLGIVDRNGVPIYFEVYGSGDVTLLLIPPSPMTHSRIWKAQIPYLARSNRVVTFDGRGNGRSGRPTGVEAYRQKENEADVLAVLDAADVDEAVLVAHCHACWWAVDVTATHPDRVRALVAIEPGVPHPGREQQQWVDSADWWNEIPDSPAGWELFNRHTICHDLSSWLEFFFDALLVEPHSTRQYEEALAWGLGTTGEILAASEEAWDLDLPDRAEFEARCRSLGVPTLVIHGDRDVCQSVERGRAFAELTGGELVVIEGAGHLTPVREPVIVNRSMSRFLERLTATTQGTRTWTRGRNRDKKVLFLSSPIGLGHTRRDLAIAAELRRRHPGVQIDWLTQHPVTAVLEAEGETMHPASAWLASESAHVASEADGHDLHCFQALRRMDEILVANFMIFQEVVEDGLYDLIVGDEAWDIDHFWHENPELKRGAHVWLTDFVGFLPMPVGGDHEAFLTADYNREMIEHIARFPRIRDRSIFVGNPADIVPGTFGPNLPNIREWTEEHFDFSGYITGFTPPTPDQAAQWRHDLGYGADETICVVTVGGSGVGHDLLERAIHAHRIAQRSIPSLRMIAVAGPRIDPESLPVHPGVEVRGYVSRLYEHLSVCDLAVVQGGLTTTMELAAAKRPFLYFPLRHHFEQRYHVRHRLEQYGAGRFMDFDVSDPDAIAAAMVAALGSPADCLDVETDGAVRAGAMIAELL